jgi:hypothetical protein
MLQQQGDKMKITKRQLRRLINEGIDAEYMKEEILSFAEEADANGIAILLDIIGGPPLASGIEADLDGAFDIIDKHVSGSYPEDLAYIHQEMTNEGLFG